MIGRTRAEVAFKALDRADAASRTLSLQSRTMTRAIRCGDPVGFVGRLFADGQSRVRIILRQMFPPAPLTEEDAALLAKIEAAEHG